MREKNYSWEPLGFRIKRGAWVNFQGFKGSGFRDLGFWVVGFTEFGCRSSGLIGFRACWAWGFGGSGVMGCSRTRCAKG